MKLPLYQLDAFAADRFRGNPAAVCPLEEWLDDATLQAIAAENNLAETAFFVGRDGSYHIRWFTPTTEMPLCGHATLASARVIFDRLAPARGEVQFQSRSGELRVARDGELLALDFPALPGTPCSVPDGFAAAMSLAPRELLCARNLLAVYGSEEEVRGLKPDFDAEKRLDAIGVIATAPGSDVDYVSRYFAPGAGVPEDPATGSAQCTLVPYWAARLGRTRLRSRQVSARVGEFSCELRGDRVKIAGRVVPYLEGTIEV
jgi:predicted PhzF superfamily epimerase YddE/YHI9